MATETVELTSWERHVLTQHASLQALQYFSHYATRGLFEHEVDTLNRWNDLAAKLAGIDPPEHYKYQGHAGNGFNRNAS